MCVCDVVQLSVFHYLSVEKSLSGTGHCSELHGHGLHFIDPKYKHIIRKIRLRNPIYCYMCKSIMEI